MNESSENRAITVRKSDEGALLLPQASDIVSDSYLSYLLTSLEERADRWVGVLSEVLARPTPPEWVQPRQGPHGMTLYYVEGAYAKITRQAIARLGIASDFDILQTDVTPEEVNCLGKLTFKYKGESASATQWGMCMRRSGVALGYTKKGAATDAEKKCLNEFGWAMDVYTTEAEAVEPPDPIEMKAKAVEGLYEVGSRAGMTREEVDLFVGGKPSELEQKDLTSFKRKLERKIREDVDSKTKTIVGAPSLAEKKEHLDSLASGK